MDSRCLLRMLETAPLGILGGTFDPVHLGHLRLAEEARQQLGLAEICWIPAGRPPLRNTPVTRPEHRLEMVRLAIAGNPGFTIDDSEVSAVSTLAPSYTVDTLIRLRQQHGQRPLVLLLGADAFARLESWHRWRELLALAHIAVATRPGHAQKVGDGGTAQSTYSWGAALADEFARRKGTAADLNTTPAGRITLFTITPLDISATAIRDMISQNMSPRYLVAEAVVGYIDSNQLYS